MTTTPDITVPPMPIEKAAAAASGPQPVQQPAPAHLSLWGKIHADVAAVGHVVSRLLPVAERLATNPRLDSLMEAALMADDLDVEAAVFQGVTDQLRAASARKAQPGADVQVVTTPAPTGPQAVIAPGVDPAAPPAPITPQVIA